MPVHNDPSTKKSAPWWHRSDVIESVIARDALGLDESQAADLMSWAAKSLIRSALAEASD